MERKIVLEVEGLCKFFGGIKAVNQVYFKLYEREILGIVGDNGAGKSTLIKIIRGAIEPTSGEIFLRDKRIIFHSPRDAMNHGIQCVYQDLALVNKLSVIDNFFLGREEEKKVLGFLPILSEMVMKKKAKSALREIGYEEIEIEEKVSNLSGGQRQAVAIARAVFAEPEPDIVLMDEPTSALSEKGKQKVFQFVMFLKQKHSVILVSHDLNAALQVCDRIIILKLGEIVFESDVCDGLSVQQLVSLM